MKKALLLLASIAGGYFGGILILRTILRTVGPQLYQSVSIFAPAAILWLLALAALALGLRRLVTSGPRNIWRAAISSAVAIGISCSGLTEIHLSSTTTVNGRVTSHIESKWFFWASLALSLATFTYALWRSRKPTTPVQLSGEPGALGGQAP